MRGMDAAGPASTTPTTPAPPPPPATLHHDVPCIRCGYDLRGLSDDGLCPECGAGIGDSLARFVQKRAAAARPLAETPRAWVVKLAIGCTMLALLGLAVFGVTVVQFLFDPRWRAAWAPINVLMVPAFWLLTADEPSVASARVGERAPRWIVRVAAPIIAGWMILNLPRSSSDFTWPPVFAFLSASVTACVMFQLARLAARMPRRGALRVEAVIAMVALPVATFVQVVVYPGLSFSNGRRWWTLPEPVIGEASALVTVPYAIMLGPRWDAAMIFWTALAVLMAWVLTLLPRLAIGLWVAAAAPRRRGVR